MDDPIIDYLQQINAIMSRHAGGAENAASFLLRHGRAWKGTALPKTVRRMAPRACYYNAAKLAMRRKDLIYVEGYGMNILPFAHAWCIDRDGNVIDPTWDEPEKRHYFGIPFRTEFVRRFLGGTKLYSLLDRPDLGFPIQTGEIPEAEWKVVTA